MELGTTLFLLTMALMICASGAIVFAAVQLRKAADTIKETTCMLVKGVEILVAPISRIVVDGAKPPRFGIGERVELTQDFLDHKKGDAAVVEHYAANPNFRDVRFERSDRLRLVPCDALRPDLKVGRAVEVTDHHAGGPAVGAVGIIIGFRSLAEAHVSFGGERRFIPVAKLRQIGPDVDRRTSADFQAADPGIVKPAQSQPAESFRNRDRVVLRHDCFGLFSGHAGTVVDGSGPAVVVGFDGENGRCRSVPPGQLRKLGTQLACDGPYRPDVLAASRYRTPSASQEPSTAAAEHAGNGGGRTTAGGALRPKAGDRVVATQALTSFVRSGTIPKGTFGIVAAIEDHWQTADVDFGTKHGEIFVGIPLDALARVPDDAAGLAETRTWAETALYESGKNDAKDGKDPRVPSDPFYADGYNEAIVERQSLKHKIDGPPKLDLYGDVRILTCGRAAVPFGSTGTILSVGGRTGNFRWFTVRFADRTFEATELELEPVEPNMRMALAEPAKTEGGRS